MKPSEVVTQTIAATQCDQPAIKAMSFDKFLTSMATLFMNDEARSSRYKISDELGFHHSVAVTLGDDFLPAAFGLKATALNIQSGDTDNMLPAMATDWPWISQLDEIDREIYRDMNSLYVKTLLRVARDFERVGWSINTDSAT